MQASIRLISCLGALFVFFVNFACADSRKREYREYREHRLKQAYIHRLLAASVTAAHEGRPVPHIEDSQDQNVDTSMSLLRALDPKAADEMEILELVYSGD